MSEEYQQPTPPKSMRVYPDFTGLYAREDAERLGHIYNPTELARLSAEREEAGDHPLAAAIEQTKEAVGKIVGIREGMLPKPAANDGPPAIGLSGFAQTGKTTVANYIESKYGYRRQHIAEPLRAMLRTLLERFGLESELIDRYLTGDLKEDVIPCLGITSRSAQITLGTEWGRELVDPNLWARCWAVEAERFGGLAMNDSVRFPNEEEAIRDLGGFTILVERPGTRPVAFTSKLGEMLFDLCGFMGGVHDSERVDRLNPDYVVVNDGSLEQLYEAIDEIMELEAVRCAA